MGSVRAEQLEQNTAQRRTYIRRAVAGGIAAAAIMVGVEVGVEAATGAHDVDGTSIAMGVIAVLGVGAAGSTLVPSAMELWESAGQQPSRRDDTK